MYFVGFFFDEGYFDVDVWVGFFEFIDCGLLYGVLYGVFVGDVDG